MSNDPNNYVRLPKRSDATSIQGTPVSSAQPSDRDILVYDAGTNSYILSSSSGLGGGGGSGAPTTARYLTLQTDATLSQERVFTPGTGLKGTDGGANGNYTLSIDNSAVATLTGSTFTGPVTASMGVSASFVQLHTLAATTGYLRLGGNGAKTQVAWSPDGSTNHALISTTDDGNGPTFGATTQPTNLYGSSITVYGNSGDVFLYGAATQSARFGSARSYSFKVTEFQSGLSGSLTQLTDGRSYLVAGANVTISSASNGQVTISATGGGGGGGYPPDYASLTGSVFTGPITAAAGQGITGSITKLPNGKSYIRNGSSRVTVTSGTAALGDAISIDVPSNAFAPLTPQYVTLATDATLTNERVLTAGPGMLQVNGAAGGAVTYGVNTTIQDLTRSLSFSTAGAGTLSFLHSGSTVTTFDANSRVYDSKAKTQTTTATPATLFTFLSGANGRTYAFDGLVTAQATATTGSMVTKMSGHFYRSAGSMVMIDPVDVGRLSRNNNELTASVVASGGNIAVTVTGPAATYDWFGTFRIQEG